MEEKELLIGRDIFKAKNSLPTITMNKIQPANIFARPRVFRSLKKKGPGVKTHRHSLSMNVSTD